MDKDRIEGVAEEEEEEEEEECPARAANVSRSRGARSGCSRTSVLVLALVRHCARSSAFPGGAQSAFDTGPAWSLLVFLVTHNWELELCHVRASLLEVVLA